MQTDNMLANGNIDVADMVVEMWNVYYFSVNGRFIYSFESVLVNSSSAEAQKLPEWRLH